MTNLDEDGIAVDISIVLSSKPSDYVIDYSILNNDIEVIYNGYPLHISDETTHVATDEDGSVFEYISCPVCTVGLTANTNNGMWITDDNHANRCVGHVNSNHSFNWKDTLMEV